MPNSPFELKLEIGSSYVSSYLVQNIERVKFDCIFEDIKLVIYFSQYKSLKLESPSFSVDAKENSAESEVRDGAEKALWSNKSISQNADGRFHPFCACLQRFV